MTATVTLRPLETDDLLKIRAMVEATGVFRPDEVPVALEVARGAVEAPREDYWSIAAREDDRLLGYVTFGQVPCTLSTWDLYWIVVDRAAHHRGIGRMLLAQCEQTVRAEGGRLLVVETSSRPEYRAARSFYEHVGYERRATIPEYYGPGDDLVIYANYFRPSNQGTSYG